MDTANHYSIKGRVERPMTPLYSAPNTPRREEAQEENRTPDRYEQDYDRRDKRTRRRSRGDRVDRGEKREDRKCRKCGSDNHYAKDCTKNTASSCYNCGKEGHFAKDCNEKKFLKETKTMKNPRGIHL